MGGNLWSKPNCRTNSGPDVGGMRDDGRPCLADFISPQPRPPHGVQMAISLSSRMAFAMDRLGLVHEMLDGALWFHEPKAVHERVTSLSDWSLNERLGHLTRLIDMAYHLNSILDLPSDQNDDWEGEGEDPFDAFLAVIHKATVDMLAPVLTEMQALFIVANREQNEQTMN